MTYLNEVHQRESAAADAARELANRAAFSTICDYWPIRDGEANFKLLVEWCGGDLTVAKFQSFLAAGDDHADGVKYGLDWSGTRDRLLEDILFELDPQGARVTQNDLNVLFQRRAKGESVRIDQIVVSKSRQIDNEIHRMAFWSKALLRAKLAELRYRRQIKDKSASELQADLAAHRNAPNAGNPWAPYELMPANISAADIKAASQYQIKFWNHKFGVAQVNARLNGR